MLAFISDPCKSATVEVGGGPYHQLAESVGSSDDNGINTFTNIDIWEQIGEYALSELSIDLDTDIPLLFFLYITI